VIITEQSSGKATLVELAGRLDSPNAPKVHDRLAAIIAGGNAVVLDFAKVEYVTSAGFRVLLLVARQAEKAGCRFVLCAITGKVRQLFDLGGFLDVLPIARSREEALAAAQ
jgi:anti-anti-sigma factor